MANFQRPDGSISDGGWTATPLFSKINGAIPDDAEDIRSVNDPSNDTFEVSLGNLADPLDSTGHIVRIRMQKADSGGGSPGTLNVIWRLYQGTTQIATQTESAVGAGFANFTLALSGAEADNITDYDDLRVRVDADKSAGARTTWCEVSGIEFETPSGAAVLVQANFRVRSGDTVGLNVDSGWAGDLNQNVSMDLETRFRIRFEVNETGGSEVIDAYEVWAKIGAASYLKVDTTPLDWTTRTTHELIEHVQSKLYVDNATATTDILSGADAFTAGDGVGESGVSGSITLNDQHTEIEFCLLLHRMAGNDSGVTFLNDDDLILFQVRRDDGSVLDTYTNTPQITVNEPAGQVGGTYPENPDRLGPYEDGNGNKYLAMEKTPLENTIIMMKSVDGGDSWDPQDVAGGPTLSDIEGLHIIQDAANQRLLVFHHKGNSPRLNIYNTSDHGTPDDWSTIDEVIDSTADSGDQQVTGWLRSNGTIVSAYTADTDVVKEVHANVRSAGGSWGTSFKVWDLADNDNEGVVGVLGEDDHVYLFSINQVTGELLGKRINGSDDALEDLFGGSVIATDDGTVVFGDVGTTSEDRQGHTEPQYWDDAGTDKVWIGWRNATSGDLEGRYIEVGTGSTMGAVGDPVNDTDNIASSYGGSRQVVASVIRHSNGDFHAFFAITTDLSNQDRATNNNLLHSVSTDDGATWATPDTVTVRSPKNRINWIRAFEQPDGNIGLFYDDSSGLDQNNSATGGIDTGVDSSVAGITQGFNWYDEYAVGGGGDQTLVYNTIASGNAVPNPTILPQSVTAVYNLLSLTPTIFDPTIPPPIATVIYDLLSVGSTVFDPSIAPQQVTIVYDLLSVAPTVFDPTIPPPIATIVYNLLASATAVLDPTITTGAVTVVYNLLSVSPTVFDPNVLPEPATVVYNLLSVSPTVFDPTIFTQTTLTYNLLSVSPVVFDPDIAPQQVTIVYNLLGSSITVPNPTILQVLAIAYNLLGSSLSVPDPTITVGSVTLVYNLHSVSPVVHNPSIAFPSQTITYNPTVNPFGVHNPTVIPQEVLLAYNLLASASTVFDPNIAVGAVTLVYNLLSVSSTIFSPSIAFPDQTITYNLLSSATLVHNPTIDQASQSVVYNLLGSAASVFDPTITTGSVALVYNLLASSTTVFDPIIALPEQTIAYNLVASVLSVFNPSLQFVTPIAYADTIEGVVVYEPAMKGGTVRDRRQPGRFIRIDVGDGSFRMHLQPLGERLYRLGQDPQSGEGWEVVSATFNYPAGREEEVDLAIVGVDFQGVQSTVRTDMDTALTNFGFLV